MFTYISIEEFADGVVKNNKDTNRKELIASLREALAAKKSGARCMRSAAHPSGRQAAASQGRTCALPAPPARPTTAMTTRSNKAQSAEHIAPRLLCNMAFLKLHKNIAFQNVLRVSKNVSPVNPVLNRVAQDVELC